MLEVLHNSCIDRNKWNSLVALAGDGALFGHSDFLDSIHENWCGVVFGNYEAAVPIFSRHRLGKNYIFQPEASRYNDFYGNREAIHNHDLFNFSCWLKERFSLIDLHLSSPQSIPISNYQHVLKYQVVKLNKSFKIIENKFKKGCRYSLRKASRNLLSADYISEDDFISFMNSVQNAKRVFPKMYRCAIAILNKKDDCIKMHRIGCFNDQGHLLSASLLLDYAGIIYWWLCGTNSEGRRQGATHLVGRFIIHQFCETKSLLNFCGGNLPGIAFFNKSFGAIDRIYYHNHYDSLNSFERGILSLKNYIKA